MANILIVDDSGMVRRYLRRILEQHGHTIVGEAEDAAKALQIYMEGNIDLVTMDIQMFGMNGIDAVKQIKEFDKNAQIVMISSVENKNMIYEAVKSGAKHYIIKPFSDDKVIEVVESVLSGPKDLADYLKASDKPVHVVRPAPVPTSAHVHTNVSVHKEVLVPFDILMKEGKLSVTFFKQITEINVIHLRALLDGLVYIRNLKVVFVFEAVPLLFEEFWSLLNKAIGTIKLNNGSVVGVSPDPGQHALISVKVNAYIYKEYEDISW
jgi:DNA-binding NarL/FixJ family response regulator